MSDYFDVMRNFLEQQSSVVKNWQLQAELIPEEHHHLQYRIYEFTGFNWGTRSATSESAMLFNIKDDQFIIDHVFQAPYQRMSPIYEVFLVYFHG